MQITSLTQDEKDNIKKFIYDHMHRDHTENILCLSTRLNAIISRADKLMESSRVDLFNSLANGFSVCSKKCVVTALSYFYVGELKKFLLDSTPNEVFMPSLHALLESLMELVDAERKKVQTETENDAR